jgi:anaerobic selenocysteine-containing dehydrogenase
VVVDPRRSETAARADWHLAIRPGTEAHLLAAVAHTLLGSGLARPGRLAEHTNGLDDLVGLLAPYTAEVVAPVCGIEASSIVALAHRLAATPRAVVYGRMGTCTQEFGTLASWLIDVVNVLTGNLDAVGGAMFPTGALGQPSTKGAPGVGRGLVMGRVRSRVGGRPEALGEFPVTALVEEIETPGPGQVRALICVGGNPVSSNPNAARVDAALANLEFMVAVDPYLNETTRHADVILPPPSALQKSHYDVALLNFAVRNVAHYSSAVLDLDVDADGVSQLAEWEILVRLAAIAAGQGITADVDTWVAEIARSMLSAAVRDPYSSVAGRDLDELDAALGSARGPERLLEVMVRTGPYGDAFGARPGGLSLAVLEAHPHGVDLGPLQPGRIPALLRTPSGRIEAAPTQIVGDLERLGASLARDWGSTLVLVGRRHVRSNNSWMHNLAVLTRGANRCRLQIHPDDAHRLGVVDAGSARVSSRVGSLVVTAEVTDVVRPGVVSLPHGFGQDLPGVRLGIARTYAGVNTNVVTDELFIDEVSGNIALNGVPVRVEPVDQDGCDRAVGPV